MEVAARLFVRPPPLPSCHNKRSSISPPTRYAPLRSVLCFRRHLKICLCSRVDRREGSTLIKVRRRHREKRTAPRLLIGASTISSVGNCKTRRLFLHLPLTFGAGDGAETSLPGRRSSQQMFVRADAGCRARHHRSGS